MGIRKKLMQTDETRAKIQASQIINRLQNHLLNGGDLSKTQIDAAKILLSKSLPDLASVTHEGGDKPIELVARWKSS